MDKKEIKTYGDLAEKFLKCINNICKEIKRVDIIDLEKVYDELKNLISIYGAKKVAYAKCLIDEISYQSRHLETESDILSDETYYTGQPRIFLITTRIDKINKLKAELDKEIEK